MFNIGPAEVMVVLLIALIVLGPSKLPDAARQVGRALGEMRKLSSGFQAEMRDALKEPVDGKPSSAGSTAKGGGALSAPNAGTEVVPAGDASTVSDITAASNGATAGETTMGSGPVPAPEGAADDASPNDAVPSSDAATASYAVPAPGGTAEGAPTAPATPTEADATRQQPSVGAPAGGAPGEANEPEKNGTTPN